MKKPGTPVVSFFRPRSAGPPGMKTIPFGAAERSACRRTVRASSRGRMRSASSAAATAASHSFASRAAWARRKAAS